MATITLESPEATFQFGFRIGAALEAGSILALTGPLGAGKTQFSKGICAGLGYTGEVTSPTFTLIHQYEGGRLPVYHIDLYRIPSSEEALRMGIEDYLPGEGVTLLEWPEKILSLLPSQTQHFKMEISGSAGRILCADHLIVE